MIAQLGMYDAPSNRAANDRLWAAIRARLGYGPRRLNRDIAPDQGWRRSDLLLSQTCGYPFRAHLAGKVALIGTPDHGLDGCPPGYYRSVFVARADDPRTCLADFDRARFAYNDALSQSGWAAPRHHAGRIGLSFGPLVCTGGHAGSARAVLQGRADLAALDALSWQFLRRDHEWTAGLKPVAETAPTPALPYICAPDRDAGALFGAVSGAIGDLSAADRETLALCGVVRVPEAAYLAVPTPPGSDAPQPQD